MASQTQRLNTVPPARRVAITNEKVTGPPAAQMLRQSSISSFGDVEVLDNASGAGILVDELLTLAAQNPRSLHIKQAISGDLDEKMLGFAREKQEEATKEDPTSGWKTVEIRKIDQQAIPLEDSAFSHIFNNFGIFFYLNDEKALTETYRVLKPGGTAGFTSWKTIQWWPQVAQPAIAKFIPDAPTLPSPAQIFPARGWTDPSAIPAKLEKAGFSDVKVTEYDFTPDVEADKFAEATGVLIKVVTKRLWSEEDSVKFADQIEPAILRYLRENYNDGHWDGKMTALITLATKA